MGEVGGGLARGGKRLRAVRGERIELGGKALQLDGLVLIDPLRFTRADRGELRAQSGERL